MTAAQKKAKDNFKKAIAYRKKSGCTLKEAFAHVYGKKVGAVKKKAAPKKKAAKKVAKKKIGSVKKKAAPKKKAAVRNYGSHKDTASHNVKISVVSGVGASTQAGAILNIFMKRSLRQAGHSVPIEIATNDLKKIYKLIMGKNPPLITKIKKLLKKYGVHNSTQVNLDLYK